MARIAHEAPSSSRPSFTGTLAAAVRNSAGVKSFEIDLREYAELRNAIIHDDTGLPLAEPHVLVVERLEYIYKQLSAPPRLRPKYNKVDICQPTDAISQVARAMGDGRYSQMPVFDGQTILGLITSETIARWIAYRLEKDELVMSEVVIQIMGHAEDPNNWDVLGGQATIYDAKDRFDRALLAGKPLDAIVVTVNGQKAARPDYHHLRLPATDRASRSRELVQLRTGLGSLRLNASGQQGVSRNNGKANASAVRGCDPRCFLLKQAPA